MDEVSGTEFLQILQPACSTLDELLDAGEELRCERHFPEADSIGMAELEQEARFAGDWNAEPVRHAHLMPGLHFVVAEDSGRSIPSLFRDGRVPVFAPAVLGRATLEACARAFWLLEPSVGVEVRIARSVAADVRSLSRRLEMPREADPDRAKVEADRRRLEAGAKERGLVAKVPHYTDVIEHLFNVGLPRETEVGATVAKWWAGISHGEFYALRPSLGAEDSVYDPVMGTHSVPIQVTSEGIEQVIALVMLGYIAAVEAQSALFGWRTARFDTAKDAAWQMVTQRLIRPA